MLPIPSGSSVVSFIGIDPGTSFPGVSVIRYDVIEKQIVHVSAHCFNLSRLAKRLPHYTYQNDRYLRLLVFRNILTDLFRQEKPVKIASEHPYINTKMPGAVIPLAECLFMTEQTVHEYNPFLCLERIDPSSIKNAVGVKGNSGDKHAMTVAVLKIPAIMNVIHQDVESMNNNAVDSIAVAYCSLMRELDPNFHYE